MTKKTYIWISSILFMLSFLAAYHSDHRRIESVQTVYQDTGSAETSLKGSIIVAQKNI